MRTVTHIDPCAEKPSSYEIIPANWIPGPKQGEWTYEAYAKIPEDSQRYEVLDGVLYLMPSPNEEHQAISVRLVFHLGSFVLFPGRGRAYAAPFDVELSPQNVLQPDFIVILKEHLDRITETHVVGAPDLVVEIASPNTAIRDQGEKREAYARAGVSEYWIVRPEQETIEVLALEHGTYSCVGIFSGQEALSSLVLPDLSVQAEQLFPSPRNYQS